jgi:hypothetical protein
MAKASGVILLYGDGKKGSEQRKYLQEILKEPIKQMILNPASR